MSRLLQTKNIDALIAASEEPEKRLAKSLGPWSLTALGESTLRKLQAKWEFAQATFEQRLGRSEAQALKRAAFQAASKLASD